MPDSSPRSRSVIQRLTQFAQTVQGLPFSRLKLKAGARTAKLLVTDPESTQVSSYPLLGDYYTVGRSSRSSDIVVQNPVVSQRHLSLQREQKYWGSYFVIRDENSTNGIFWRKRRLRSLILKHGDLVTLGPPQLATSVQLRYFNPPPALMIWLQRGMLILGGIVSLAVTAIVIESSKVRVFPLPVGVTGPVAVYARDGETLLNPLRTQSHQEMTKLMDYSPFLTKAVMASEDSRYPWHVGVDPIGVLRAVITNFRHRELTEGASTITQQLSRSLFRDYVGTTDSLGRKVREAIVALKLETFYSKDELLLNYLNRVYLGSGLYGFEDAAQFYFGKSARDLSLSEAATLAGILPAPNRINPVRDYNLSVQYRDRVIERMVALGWVTPEEGRKARRSRIEIHSLAQQELQSNLAPYFYDEVFNELDTLLGKELAQEGNFIVQTSLDAKMQRHLDTTLKSDVVNEGNLYGFKQAAIVTLDAQTGEIRALAGGLDYSKSQFNRVTQALRQPGSTFKIFTYTAALEQGISPNTSYSCTPLIWQGQEFGGCGGSSLSFPTAVALSANVVALRVAQNIGLDAVIQMSHRMGVTTKLVKTPGLVLGQSEVSPLEMTSSFAVLANQGKRNSPHTITKILDSSDCKNLKNIQTCRVIFDHRRQGKPNQAVVSSDVANSMTDLLRGVVRAGTGSAAAIGLDAAGKTGTTNNSVDLWFIGYLPGYKLTTGVWLGNDDNTPTQGSSTQAAALWGKYMSKVAEDLGS